MKWRRPIVVLLIDLPFRFLTLLFEKARDNCGERVDTQFVFDFVRTHVPSKDDASYPHNIWRAAEELSETDTWVLVMDYADSSLHQVASNVGLGMGVRIRGA